MKNKIIFISTIFVFLSFIGIKNTQAATIAISTNTGVVYLTADLEKTTYAPGEEIRADLYLYLGSASPTSVSATGSANGGSASFNDLAYVVQRQRIGYAQSSPGTYNANFSYSYNQVSTIQDVPFTVEVGGAGTTAQGLPIVYVSASLAQALPSAVTINSWIEYFEYQVNGPETVSISITIPAGSTTGYGSAVIYPNFYYGYNAGIQLPSGYGFQYAGFSASPSTVGNFRPVFNESGSTMYSSYWSCSSYPQGGGGSCY